MGIFIFWLRMIIRRAFSDKLLSLFKLLGMTISLCSLFIILMWLSQEFSMNNSIKDRDQIYRMARIWESPKIRNVNVMLEAPWSPVLHEELSAVTEYTRCRPSQQSYILNDEKRFSCQMKYADSTFIDFFGFELLSGKLKDVLKAPYTVVLTHSLAAKIFNGENPVGRVIQIGNINNLTITGLVADPPQNITMGFDCLVSFTTIDAEKSLYTGWGGGDSFIHYLKLPTSTNYESITPLMMPILQKHYDYKAETAHGIYITPLLQPLKEVYLKHSGSEVMQRIIILILTAILILFVSSFNYAFISLSSLQKTNVQAAIPLVCGQGRTLSSLYFFVEGLCMTLLSAIFAFAISPLVISFLSDFLDISIQIQFNNVWIWFILIAVVVALTLLGAMFPVMWINKKGVWDLLRNTHYSSWTQKHLRHGLTVFQMAVSTAVLLFTLIVIKQNIYMNSKDLGYNKENLLYIELPDDISIAKAEVLASKLRQIPGVQCASASSDVPLYGYSGNGFQVNHDGQFNSFRHSFIDSSYLSVMGIKLKQGTALKRNQEVLVNEALLKKVKNDDYKNLTLSRVGIDFNIVGVVEDFHMQALTSEIQPLVYCLPYHEGWYSFINLRIDDVNQAAILQQIKQLYEGVLSDATADIQFYDSHLKHQYKSEESFSALLLVFTALVLGVTIIGVLAFIYLLTQQKTKEIGIRKVSGAHEFSIVSLFIKQSVILMTIAFVIALAVALPIINGWLAAYPYKTEIELVDVLKAIIPVLGIGVITIGAVSWLKASINPIKSLRYE